MYNSKITSAPCNQLTLSNCREKEEWPMDGKCQTMDAAYDCRFTWSELQKIYFGLVEEKWKQMFHNHKKLFNNKRYSHETTLSSFAWHLKKTLGVTPNMKWLVLRCSTPYSNISKDFIFILYEKLVFITYPTQHELLNKLSEIFWKCRHENKYLLKYFRATRKG